MSLSLNTNLLDLLPTNESVGGSTSSQSSPFSFLELGLKIECAGSVAKLMGTDGMVACRAKLLMLTSVREWTDRLGGLTFWHAYGSNSEGSPNGNGQ
jgi:hypothetical protein